MFDQYMICEYGFKNTSQGNKLTGFQFNACLPYHRGLGLSMYENLRIKVDGHEIPRDAIQITLHGSTYSLDEMETEYEDRWNFGEIGTVSVQKPGGLNAGEHKLEAQAFLRISYIPVILTGQCTKNLVLE